MNKVRAAINGMGRIGRLLTRLIHQKYSDSIQLVAVNDLVGAGEIRRLLANDSTYGPFPGELSMASETSLSIGGETVQVTTERDANKLPWKKLNIDVVFESTGLYLSRDKASAHIHAGAKRVVLSAPPKDDTPIFLIGVNDSELDGQTIISNASCTTNCLAPLVKAMDDGFGVQAALMSTTHAVTNGQKVVDNYGNERARSALNNIIPTTTGAALAIGKVLPHLEGRINGSSLRVPVTTGSVVEAVFLVSGNRSTDDVLNALHRSAAQQNGQSPLGTVLYVGEDYQVSADAHGSSWSSMVHPKGVMTVPAGENSLVKITAFYDNEMGYAHRLAEIGLLAGLKKVTA
jgi:glyceraldehyde 3-phosphate dehydrogenase